MSKSTSALSLISSSDVRVADAELELLKQTAVNGFQQMRRLRHEEALRGLLVGMALHRIKASLPTGHFGKWTKANLEGIGERYVNYLMRLALVFIDKGKVSKPELLALPGDQTELAIDGMEGAQRRFAEKAVKFVGDLSLHELLIKHNIKSVGVKTELTARNQGDEGEPATAPTPEELYHQSRDEIGLLIERGETLFLKENRLQYLAGHPEEVAGVVKGLRDLADKVEHAAKPLLKSAK